MLSAVLLLCRLKTWPDVLGAVNPRQERVLGNFLDVVLVSLGRSSSAQWFIQIYDPLRSSTRSRWPRVNETRQRERLLRNKLDLQGGLFPCNAMMTCSAEALSSTTTAGYGILCLVSAPGDQPSDGCFESLYQAQSSGE